MSIAMIADSIRDDIRILLSRALLNKTVSAFGEDGLGKHGRSDVAKFFEVIDVEVEFDMDADGDYTARAFLVLDEYEADEVGHICTDLNFLISVRKLLAVEHLDPASVDYADISEQCDDAVCLKIDADLLLEWA